jgi:hypothetical protein
VLEKKQHWLKQVRKVALSIGMKMTTKLLITTKLLLRRMKYADITRGEDCDDSHPKPCRKLMEHGSRSPRGCQGNCKSFHPRMCSRSLKNGECLNDQCTFVHVKGTKRKKDNASEGSKGEEKKINPENKNEPPHKDHANNGEDYFLYLLHNFKTKIIETIDNKLNTMMTTLMTPRTYQQPMQMQMPMPWMGMQQYPIPHKN